MEYIFNTVKVKKTLFVIFINSYEVFILIKIGSKLGIFFLNALSKRLIKLIKYEMIKVR